MNKIFSDILLAGISIYTFWQFLVLSSVYIGQCTHLTVIHFFSTVRCVHWIMYTLDSNKIDFTVCSDINGWRLTGAIADLFFTKYNGNILGVTRVHWRIYSLGVEQYIPRRFAPLDILHNPSGVYYPIYPCHPHYIITMGYGAVHKGRPQIFPYFIPLRWRTSVYSNLVHWPMGRNSGNRNGVCRM